MPLLVVPDDQGRSQGETHRHGFHGHSGRCRPTGFLGLLFPPNSNAAWVASSPLSATATTCPSPRKATFWLTPLIGTTASISVRRMLRATALTKTGFTAFEIALTSSTSAQRSKNRDLTVTRSSCLLNRAALVGRSTRAARSSATPATVQLRSFSE